MEVWHHRPAKTKRVISRNSGSDRSFKKTIDRNQKRKETSTGFSALSWMRRLSHYICLSFFIFLLTKTVCFAHNSINILWLCEWLRCRKNFVSRTNSRVFLTFHFVSHCFFPGLYLPNFYRVLLIFSFFIWAIPWCYLFSIVPRLLFFRASLKIILLYSFIAEMNLISTYFTPTSFARASSLWLCFTSYSVWFCLFRMD